MTDLYTHAISYILKRKSSLPYGETSFYLVKNDLDIAYTDVDDQTLVVTNTSNRENVTIDSIAESLGVRRQDIFSGALTDEQINLLSTYFEGDRSLPALISEVIGSNLSSLNKSLDDVVEGYIFSIGGALYKLEDKRFVKKEFKKINTSNYELLVNEIVSFFSPSYVESMDVYEEKRDFRYIEIVSKMFVDFCRAKESEIDFLAKLPTFSDNTGSVNTNYLNNKEAIKYIKSSDKYEYLFRVFLQLFRRVLEPRGLIDISVCETHKAITEKINNRANSVGMPTFEESLKLKQKHKK